jgi:hypothetical protein
MIIEGNEKGWWTDPLGNPIQLPVMQLLQDCETQWSSTYLMIDRFLKLYPVSQIPTYIFYMMLIA